MQNRGGAAEEGSGGAEAAGGGSGAGQVCSSGGQALAKGCASQRWLLAGSVSLKACASSLTAYCSILTCQSACPPCLPDLLVCRQEAIRARLEERKRLEREKAKFALRMEGSVATERPPKVRLLCALGTVGACLGLAMGRCGQGCSSPSPLSSSGGTAWGCYPRVVRWAH